MRLYKRFFIICCVLVLSACTTAANKNKVVASNPDEAGISRLAKSDINEVVEYHQRAVMRDLQQLMLKLYKRNPQGRHDEHKRTIEESVALFFSRPHNQGYPHWSAMNSNDIVRISLDESYQGEDRVLPFIFGLRKMLMASYDDHIEFYYLTSIEGQKLYNSARNVEIAAWMLAEKRDLSGELLLLSDSLESEKRNLSYQRLIGRMIATQDNLAEIMSYKSGRLIKTVVVKAASMVFLPI